MTPDQVKKALDFFFWYKCGYNPNLPKYRGRDYKARSDRWILKKD